MRMRGQTVCEVDAPAIEELAADPDSDEHRRVTVLGDADGRGSRRSSSRHGFLLQGLVPAADAVACSRPDNAPAKLRRACAATQSATGLPRAASLSQLLGVT